MTKKQEGQRIKEALLKLDRLSGVEMPLHVSHLILYGHKALEAYYRELKEEGGK